ncbi:cellulose synthase-like protein H1 [Momordica charantia]|uniref:Cellulose synthase-like protein H1 n=1 Tax=Momordica charantia TaxID=3673 RepID=A0A6J1CI91_MOMCH|nr:cellulose synthase-like protein H1 [Momordica charantia]
MANPNPRPLYRKFAVSRILQRALDVTILFLLISLLAYRLLFLRSHGFSWLYAIAFLCECYFTFATSLAVNLTWSPVDYKTYPDRLLKRIEELPPVDLFVTTADPVLEPPIITVNTVLSLLAVDYPADKLACYVSDDGCSPLTFYSLSEALKFAKIWVPFCKKYKVGVRAPFRYFSGDLASDGSSTEFQCEWRRMKDEYEQLRQRIDEAAKNFAFRDIAAELADIDNTKPNNHAPIIKVIWENKEGLWDGLPHLIYVSREKKPQLPHHYKAGAMNVLTRVSGLMTNAPYMLNVDCDMFVNNPSVLLHGMCLFLDPMMDKECAFVQFPQCFYNGPKDDPFGNQWIVIMELIFRGMAGVQGPGYMGTGCIHRRKVLYGQSQNEANVIEKRYDDELYKTFGNSKDFVTSATRTLRSVTDNSNCLSNSIKSSSEVATADYEHNSCWGSKVGWQYGSVVEDVLTGMEIHKRGWKSAYITPTPPAFLGCAPSGGPVPLTHQKRAMTGLLEIFLSRRCPIFTALSDKLQFRQRLFYLWMFLMGLRSIPEICYATLPAFCLIANTHFLPKVQEPVIWIPLLLFVLVNLQQLLEYLETGQSIRAWWNNQRMERIKTMCSSLLGMVAVIMKILGLSETVFEVTKKESSSTNGAQGTDGDLGRLTFDESPFFVPGTTILMIQLAALSIGLLGRQSIVQEFGVGEVICSVWLILSFWPFLKGLFSKGRYGLPWPTLCKSSALAFLFVVYCVK